MTKTTLAFRFCVLLAATITTATIATTATAADSEREPYNDRYCTTCHGVDGRGNEGVQAPKLAGMESWYLKRQLENFRDGIRGVHENDIDGISMRAMAVKLTDESISDIIKWVGAWKSEPAPRTIQGDPVRGRNFYSACSLCHGDKGEGNEAMGAPALAGQNDWYLVTQLNNFMAGYRGSHTADTYGAQMRTMVNTLRNEAGIINVVSYINTLSQ
ncbi:MAG: cytochrome C [SAR86 cluster bacterium]|uniref:Cytochrome C n=1 Tax=SAR86 cluster bacterium TaxID=2030880 RepID=A0A2A5ADL2_9GAMM|nr:MAG: cytochrome C [SAR86 cluster bacterium]